MFNSVKTFLSYWYMRYLLVTELFMVAKWERHMFHVIALILLIVLGLFNKLVVVGGVRFLRQWYLSYTYQPVSSGGVDQTGSLLPSEAEL